MHTNKTYIVTGAASGIGAETTRHLQAQGAKVIGVDRNEAVDADSFFQVDMSDPTSIDALVAGLPEGVNGLANIAGVPPTAPAPVVMKVNLVGLRHLTNALSPKMADAASIVNIASLA
ncbi:MAG: SDR family NAD(P)-dependent oxidoreductase, partial [Thiothrix litoralis]